MRLRNQSQAAPHIIAEEFGAFDQYFPGFPFSQNQGIRRFVHLRRNYSIVDAWNMLCSQNPVEAQGRLRRGCFFAAARIKRLAGIILNSRRHELRNGRSDIA